MRLSGPTWLVVAAVAMATAMTACGNGGGDGDGGARSSDTVPVPGGDVPVRTLAEGPQGPLRAGEVVARSEAEWAAAWRDHEGPGDPPAVAGVDFANEVVVGLFAGQRPTGGFRVVPGTVNRGGSEIYAVGYEVVSPGAGCMVSQGLTSPFLVLSIPGAPEVTFSSDERAEDCQ